MNKTINRIMLVDDNPHDNFFHEREIRKADSGNMVVIKTSARDALDYLQSGKNDVSVWPDLIFLDINMPGMNGWEFLEEYKRLDSEVPNGSVVIMLTTSSNPDDMAKARACKCVFDYITKPLTKEIIENIVGRYLKKQAHL